MKKGLIYLSLLLMIIIMGSGKAENRQADNVIPGKIILQFWSPEMQEEVLAELEKNHDFAGLHADYCLSAQLGIWLMSFDEKLSAPDVLLKRLSTDKRIANAQFDHYISLREEIPNDPEFENQWALKNTGQGGGEAGADIEATYAWDITVNTATTVLGDTIVMAIVDDGLSLSHPDMRYWKNRQEIPNNSIDDDENGYIDDYDGWNAYYHSGYISPKDHGQHVAGIAGAIGNNGIGVSGINWNGRILPVAGSSEVESTVVEAYAYVYTQRSLYDETNGAKGAYIVAMNSSFGINFGQPEDYPIWGAMYDSLGGLGILCPAATINGPWDVDKVGDIPTTFSSEYVIGVTNTNKYDEKALGAGWGTVSIDLGAPGHSIMSTRIPNTYGYKSGTSMATPQVTGSIAMMYAAADAAFLNKYHEHPGMMAVFIKKLILDGVDTLSNFDTLCVSGGRLNLNNSIRKLVNPRIGVQDTLSITLAADSTGSIHLVIENLLGFQLPYETNIVSMPAWLSFTPEQQVLAPHGSDSIYLGFDAGGMADGKYYCELLITDVADMLITCVIELQVGESLYVNENPGSAYQLSYYPNPFTSGLNISVESNHSQLLHYEIYNISGKLLNSWQIMQDNNGRQMCTWDGKDYKGQSVPAGIYFLRVSGEEGSRSVKLIKASY